MNGGVPRDEIWENKDAGWILKKGDLCIVAGWPYVGEFWSIAHYPAGPVAEVWIAKKAGKKPIKRHHAVPLELVTPVPQKRKSLRGRKTL